MLHRLANIYAILVFILSELTRPSTSAFQRLVVSSDKPSAQNTQALHDVLHYHFPATLTDFVLFQHAIDPLSDFDHFDIIDRILGRVNGTRTVRFEQRPDATETGQHPKRLFNVIVVDGVESLRFVLQISNQNEFICYIISHLD